MAEPVRLLVFSKDATLFLSGADTQGDAQSRHVRYARVLREQLGGGSEIRVITYTTRASGHRLVQPAPGLTVHGTASRHRALYLLDAIRLVPKVLKDGWRPSGITVQTPWEEGVVGAVLSRMLGARFLTQLHFDLFSPEWLAEHPLNRWRQFVARQVLRSASRLRVVSEPLRQNIARRVGIDAAKIDVIPVGVNFKPSTLSVDDAKAALDARLVGHPLVLFVGRLVESKNLPLWLDVAETVLLERPETRFVIVGDGEEMDMLRATIATRGRPESILLVGPVGHERLPDVYRAADLFLLTANHEGFGRVVLEAALAGVPTVSTACTGPEDIIEDGVSGVLNPKGDGPALAKAVLDLLANDARRTAMGKAALDLCTSRFGLDALAGRLVQHWSAR